MPTESAFFFAGLLFVAAGLGYVFARFGDLDDEDEIRDAARANFLKGFRYLLNEEPDRAVEAFTTSAEINEEVIDTQVALGSLFRRRGELDRAIRLHENLLERTGLNTEQRERAMFALAEDYLAAGLFDRAEELFLRLRDSQHHRSLALQRLLRICEVTQEWDRAVDLCGDLRRVDAGSVEPERLGHYYCELAEQAHQARESATAQQNLAQAEAASPGLPRAALLAADFAAEAGDRGAAAAGYWALLEREPSLVSELLPRLVSVKAMPASAGSLPAAVVRLTEQGAGSLRRLVATVVTTRDLDLQPFQPVLARYVATEPVLAPLVDLGSVNAADAPTRERAIRALQLALQAAVRATPRYQCGNCGYQSAALQWQCPGCRRWDSVRSTDRLFPAAG